MPQETKRCRAVPQEDPKATSGNQGAREEHPARKRRPPRFPIDRRSIIGRRVARFEHDLVATTLAGNRKSKGIPRPLDAGQLAKVRLACAYEALCARLETDLLTGASLDHRVLADALARRDGLVRGLTSGSPYGQGA